MTDEEILRTDIISSLIRLLRGQSVLLSHDLAKLYAVETRVLVQAVKRNLERFPEDFMFQLTEDESKSLRSQIVISKRGGSRVPPYAFTEQGVAMLSSVLNSRRAIGVNIEIMRAFVQMRGLAIAHAEIEKRLDSLEAKYDGQFAAVFDAIRQLVAAPEPKRKRIGFRVEERKRPYPSGTKKASSSPSTT